LAGRIEDYAIVGDMQSVALVCRDGCVDWLCLPRFDSQACFAALLGTEEHGHWLIAPTPAVGGPAATATRRYAGETLILETDWETPDGAVRVTDFMPPRDEDPPSLIRIVDGLRGTVSMDVEVRLRFGYGSILPWVYKAGDRVPFTLTYQPSHQDAPPAVDARECLEETRKFWHGWVSRCTYHGPYRDAVVRSLITLKALTYQPTGGIVAAATTSLPEDIGGERNWDYRYCWLRDATITLEALAVFEKLLSLRNDVGLLSEEFDPRYGRLVGNMPQAFSHVPLIQTALNLSNHAEEHRRGTTAIDERRIVPG